MPAFKKTTTAKQQETTTTTTTTTEKTTFEVTTSTVGTTTGDGGLEMTLSYASDQDSVPDGAKEPVDLTDYIINNRRKRSTSLAWALMGEVVKNQPERKAFLAEIRGEE
jgi:hypothetical protein